MDTRMSVAEREAFLADVHVGVLTVADGEDRGPLAVPVGYLYEPGGDIVFTTDTESRKVTLIRAAGRAGFLVQSEAMPFKYVSVEGPVVEGPVNYELDLAITLRYLDRETAEQWVNEAAERGDFEVKTAVRIRPERWRTYDSGKEGWE
jgi:hypothetical protein